MNEETNDFLKFNLEEAHATFKTILSEMKDNNIDFDYNEIEMIEMNSYSLVSKMMKEMYYYVINSNIIRENNKEIFHDEYRFYLKYFTLYLVSLVFIRLFYEIFDTSKLNEMIKYVVGMGLGSTYIGLLSKDISDNRSSTKERRDIINELKTMKEEYKKNHDKVVFEINSIFALNDYLWSQLDKGKTKNK